MKETWRRVEELFHAALELPASADRDSWLRRECRGDAVLLSEVRSLLASAEQVQTRAMAGRVAVAAGRAFAAPEPRAPRAGPYRLLRVLGEGGMGTVWLAERDDGQFERRVAVKLVRRGMDTEFLLRRFRRERQILARLDHPNIGRLLDGGTLADGTPYLVMEYVEGRSITRYCEDEKVSTRERVRLFLDVCAAVQHAHASLVVHRDLKPGNILVDGEGRPKLLDFGICKLLVREVTADGASGAFAPMTPEYASPEQVSGEPVTAASDVYSLGAVLYELLAGARATTIVERSPAAIEDAVCRRVLRRPSDAARASGRPDAEARARALEGDLDAIALRAMRKDPAERYGSAAELADDLRRFLEDRPVAARPGTPAYRAWKLLRRNRAGVAAAAVLLVAAGWGVRQVYDVRRELVARQAADDSLALELARADLRLGELAAGDPGARDLARERLEKARALAERLLVRTPASREARDVQRRALEGLARLGGPG